MKFTLTLTDSDRLSKYVERFFARSGNTEWPTVRRAAKSLGWSLDRVRKTCEGDQELFLTSFQALGEHFVERSNPPKGKSVKKKACKLFVSRLVVSGSGEFPMDMLRYDGCMPWNTPQADAMRKDGLSREKRQVTLRRVCPNDRGAEADRWASFGWTVVEEIWLEGWSA